MDKMNEPQKIKYKGTTYYGYKSPCPEWLHNAFRTGADYICQDCKKPESKVGKLQPHRIKRGVEKGLYVVVHSGHPLSNVKMLCRSCHEKYNYSRKLPSFTTKKSNTKYIKSVVS